MDYLNFFFNYYAIKMTNLFKIGFLSAFLLAIYYLGALFCYLPDDSEMHSKSAMEGACYFYLLVQLFILYWGFLPQFIFKK